MHQAHQAMGSERNSEQVTVLKLHAKGQYQIRAILFAFLHLAGELLEESCLLVAVLKAVILLEAGFEILEYLLKLLLLIILLNVGHTSAEKGPQDALRRTFSEGLAFVSQGA